MITREDFHTWTSVALALAAVGSVLCTIVVLALLNARQQHSQLGRFILIATGFNLLYALAYVGLNALRLLLLRDDVSMSELAYFRLGCGFDFPIMVGFWGMLISEASLLAVTLRLWWVAAWYMPRRYEVASTTACIVLPLALATVNLVLCLDCTNNEDSFGSCDDTLTIRYQWTWIGVATLTLLLWVGVLVAQRSTNNSLAIHFDPFVHPSSYFKQQEQLIRAKKNLLATVWSPVRLFPLQFLVFAALQLASILLYYHNKDYAFFVVHNLFPLKQIVFVLFYVVSGRDCRDSIADLFFRPRLTLCFWLSTCCGLCNGAGDPNEPPPVSSGCCCFGNAAAVARANSRRKRVKFGSMPKYRDGEVVTDDQPAKTKPAKASALKSSNRKPYTRVPPGQSLAESLQSSLEEPLMGPSHDSMTL
eukprot:m.5660 g.5660  ORF g.5660 m.5660 type:complete len:419 (+) comp2433_c0_seq1:564-1820(+)